MKKLKWNIGEIEAAAGKIALTAGGDTISEIASSSGPFTIEVYEYNSRTLTANSYMWSLCKEIGLKIGLTDKDVYRNAVSEAGPYARVMSESPEKLMAVWESQGIGWQAFIEEALGEGAIVRLYQGSSAYTRKEMANLISNLECDAKELGVETIGEKQLGKLLDRL